MQHQRALQSWNQNTVFLRTVSAGRVEPICPAVSTLFLLQLAQRGVTKVCFSSHPSPLGHAQNPLKKKKKPVPDQNQI